MRRLRYQVASSLDGYIAGAKGELDWIVMDPEIDFGELFKQYDTVVVGRRTFEVMLKEGRNGSMPALDVVVFSQRLRQKDFPAVSVVSTNLTMWPLIRPGSIVQIDGNQRKVLPIK